MYTAPLLRGSERAARICSNESFGQWELQSDELKSFHVDWDSNSRAFVDELGYQ